MALNPRWVHEGDYYYDGHLKVNLGNDYYHERASPTEIKRLLRQPKTVEDRKWHFYVSQLKHYNLPWTNKDNKAAAKLRLHEAINDDKLHVPAETLALEVRLKEGYDKKKKRAWRTSRRKAKAAERARTPKRAKATVKSEGTVANTHSGHGCNVTVNNFYSPHSAQPHWSSQGAFFPKSPTKASPSKRKRVASPFYTPSKDARIFPRKKSAGPRIRYAERSSSSESEDELESELDLEQEADYEAVAEDNDENMEEEMDDDIDEGFDEAMDDDEDADCVGSSRAYNGSKFNVAFNGAYSVRSDELTSKHGDAAFGMELNYGHKCKVWWTAFVWGNWSGMMQIDAGPRNVKDIEKHNYYPLTWRYHDTRKGHVLMGRHCEGTITFHTEHEVEDILKSTVRGELWNLFCIGTVTFEGERVGEIINNNGFQEVWGKLAKPPARVQQN